MTTTTLYQFAPSVTANYSFSPTLDGAQYSVIISWQLFGRRWIVNVYDLSGNLVLAKPLRSSPDDYDINIIGGYFTSTTMVYRESTGNFEVTS